MSAAASLVHKKADLGEMWDIASGIATDIEARQTALIKAGIRTSPDPDRIRQAQVLTQICLLIEVIREVEDDLRRLVAKKRGWVQNR